MVFPFAGKRRVKLHIEELEARLTPDAASYVSGLYSQVLDRIESLADMNYWGGQLPSQGNVGVAADFWMSAEHRGDQVDAAYQNFLGRSENNPERQYWVNGLTSGSLSEAQMDLALLTSPEYLADHPGNANYVQALYHNLLGRAAGTSEQWYWTQQLLAGASDTQVAQAILTSPSGEAGFVAQDYQTLLGRTGTSTEYAYWVSVLQQHSSPSLETVATDLLSTSEFLLDHPTGTPAPAPQITGLPASGTSSLGTALSLQGSVANALRGEQDAYAWQVSKNGAPFASGTGWQFTFTPNTGGTYTITLAATNQLGTRVSVSQTETVNAPLVINTVPPAATLVAPTTVNEGSTFTVALTNPVDTSSADTAFGFHYAFALNGTSLAGITYATAGTSASHNFTFTDGLSIHTITACIIAADNTFANYTVSIHVNYVAPTTTISSPSGGAVWSAITFTGNATDPSAPDTAAGFQYSWNFGDGSTSTLARPSHPYAAAGTYTVTLNVTDTIGGTASASTTIHVVPPTPAFVIDDSGPGYSQTGTSWINWTGGAYDGELEYNGSPPGAVNATWQGSGLATNYYQVQATWTGYANHTSAAAYSIYDGNTLVQTVTVNQQLAPNGPTFGGVPFQTLATVPIESGEIRVVLVNQVGGYLIADAIRVNPMISPPTATFSGPSSVLMGSPTATVAFSNPTAGTGGYTYSYDFNDTGTFEITGSSNPTAIVPASFLASGPTTRVVHGRITDNYGDFTDYTTSIAVVPIPQATIAGGPASGHGQEGAPIALQGSVSNPAAGALYSYAWQVTDNGTPFDSGSGEQFTFTPDDQNTYVVTLTATNQLNNSTSATQTITADIPPPSATLAAPTTVNEGSPFTVTLTNPVDSSSADVTAGFHYAFALDGTSLAGITYATAGTSASQSFTFTDGLSTHTVTVCIIAQDGGFAEYTTSVQVNYVPPTAIIGGPYTGAAGSAITFTGNGTDPSVPDTAAGFEYSWSFGDGGTSTMQSPSHTYATAGTYTATLTVTDQANGITSSVSTTSVLVYLQGSVSSNASFVGADMTTQGNWVGTYGGDGYDLIGDLSNIPAYAQVSLSGETAYVWTTSSSAACALQKASNPNSRLEATWGSNSSFTIDVNFTDSQTHRLALYFLDLIGGISETVNVLDAGSGTLLNSQTVSAFTNGKYLVYNLSGHVQIQVTDLTGPYALVSGLFFGPAGSVSTPTLTAPTTINAYPGTATPFGLGSLNDWVGDGPWAVTVNWGDSTNSTFTTTGPGTLSQTHSYANPGTYAATVTVTNQHGLSASANFSVQVFAMRSPADLYAPTIVTPYDTIPNFGQYPTVFNTQSGNWSNPSTWSTGMVPGAGAIVSIEPNTTVTYDVVSTAAVNTVIVQSGGQLVFRTDINTELTVVNFLVLAGGLLQIGTQANPEAANATAQIVFPNQPLNISSTTQLTIDDGVPTQTSLSQPASTVLDPGQYGNGLIVLGTMNAYGAPKTQAWLPLAVAPMAGATTLTLSQPLSGWQVGDKLLLPDTQQLTNADFGTYTSEIETPIIAAISANGTVVTLTSPLQYNHLGATNVNGVVEYLPDVADLTRNVSIHSANAAGNRGYVMFTYRANVNINYVTFGGLGRVLNEAADNTIYDANGNVLHLGTNEDDRFAVTFNHLIGPVTAQADGYQYTFVGNVVMCPLSPMPYRWGIALDASDYGLIRYNVVFNWVGAGIALETGSESYNLIDHNFVVRVSGTGIREQGGLSGDGFWLLGGNNDYITNNVASDIMIPANAGGNLDYAFEIRGSGLQVIPAYQGADPSIAGQSLTIHLDETPILEFTNNEAYGAMLNALGIWEIGADGTLINGLITGPSLITNFVAWHFSQYGYFGYPTDLVTFDHPVMLGDPSILANPDQAPVGMQCDDYATMDFTIDGADIEGMQIGIQTPMLAYGVITIENCYLRNETDIAVFRMESVSNPSTWSPVVIDINNDLFVPLPGVALSSIEMVWQAVDRPTDMIELFQVFVNNYNQVAGDDFQVFFLQQSPNFIVPQGATGIIASPVAGLTNQQSWTEYGIAIAGAVSPTTNTMAGIIGYVLPL